MSVMVQSKWYSRLEERPNPRNQLKEFTIFNKLPSDLRWEIWSRCMAPPGRAVFDHCQKFPSSSFHPDEDVVSLADNFFWLGTPVLFQICRESRYIGKLSILPVTGLSIFHDGTQRFSPTFQISTQNHPDPFFLRKLWFSPKDTIEIPIRSSVEFPEVEIAASQIAQAWVAIVNPLRVRKVQFSFLVTENNKLDHSVVEHLGTICSLISRLGRSVTVFIGMGAGYAHKYGQFYLNDDQEDWIYNEDGTLYSQERQKYLQEDEGILTSDCESQNEDEDGDENVPDFSKREEQDTDVKAEQGVIEKPGRKENIRGIQCPEPNIQITSSEPSESEAKVVNTDGPVSQIKRHSTEVSPTRRRKRVVIPKDSQCAVCTSTGAYTYCVNSEIIEEHIAKINPHIQYVDQIRAGLVQDRMTSGWKPGEASRCGFSFNTTGLY